MATYVLTRLQAAPKGRLWRCHLGILFLPEVNEVMNQKTIVPDDNLIREIKHVFRKTSCIGRRSTSVAGTSDILSAGELTFCTTYS